MILELNRSLYNLRRARIELQPVELLEVPYNIEQINDVQPFDMYVTIHGERIRLITARCVNPVTESVVFNGLDGEGNAYPFRMTCDQNNKLICVDEEFNIIPIGYC